MKKFVNHIAGCALAFGLLVASHSMASELTVPNQFSSGDVTSASDMNANFAAIEAAVNDNYARIQEGMQSQSRPVFVGFSEPVHGYASLDSWQQACHNVTAGSHICTQAQLIAAPYNPEAPIPSQGTAWMIKITNEVLSCPTTSYPIAIRDGRMHDDAGSCSNTFPIACCK